MLVVRTSAAILRGPYVKVSCSPRVFAVSWMDAVFGLEEGTMRRDESCEAYE